MLLEFEMEVCLIPKMEMIGMSLDTGFVFAFRPLYLSSLITMSSRVLICEF